MSNSSQKTIAAKWQVPLKPHSRRCAIAYDQVPDNIKAKFRELYPISYNRELVAWFGILPSSVRTFAAVLGLRKDRSAICRRRNAEGNAYRHGYLARLRETDPERYDDVRRRITETMRKKWKRARREKLYAMRPTTRLHVAPLTEAAYRYKYRACYEHGYFADPDHPYWLCYDSQTRRSAKVEENAKQRGFEIVEGEG